MSESRPYMIFLALFDINLHEKGAIWIQIGQCAACGSRTEVLGMNASEEYQPGFICRACINTAFADFLEMYPDVATE